MDNSESGLHDPYKNNLNNLPPPPPYSSAQQYQYGGPSESALPYPAQPQMAGFPTTFLPKTDNPGYPQPGSQPNPVGYPQSGFQPNPVGYPQSGFQPNPAGYFIPPPPTQMVYPSANQTNTDGGFDDGNNFSASGAIMEDPNWKGFSDKAIRNAFIRKVYAILMVQLAFTVGVIALFIFHKGVKNYVQNHFGMYIAAYVTFLGVYIALACCKDLRRKYPTNLILLSIFTVCLTYLVATISSFHDTEIVIMALGICTACCLVISIFSCFTKFDLTSCGGVLFILVWVLFFFGIMCIFTHNQIMNTIYAGLGAFLFMMFLAYDTQMVMGGKKYQLSPEEHIFAALQLYIDIVYIFLFIMALLGGGRK